MVTVAVLWFLGAAGARADIVCDPSLLTLSQTIPGGEVVIDYTGGGSANLAGYSLDIVWDNTLATAVFARPTTGPFSAAATFFVVNLANGHVRVDAAIGGADPGIATGELLKVNFTAQAGVVGTSSLDLTIL